MKPRAAADSFGSYLKTAPFVSPCAIAWNASAGREAHSEFRHGSRASRFGSLKALTKGMRVRRPAVGVTFHFCPECGSTVFWEALQRPDLIAVAVGMFADSDFEGPRLSVWEGRQHPWTIAIGNQQIEHSD
jgi:hypothetical protein